MEHTHFNTIYLATDHAGFDFKELVKAHLIENPTYKVIDCGAETYQEGDDYPEYIAKAAEKVSIDASSEISKTAAIIFGGSGQGEAIVASRFPFVRTTVCYGGPDALEIVKLGRQHNNANVLSIGARFVKDEQLLMIVDTWLATEFLKEERHTRRLAHIDNK
jgi:ribose 5-phosphate isomerase B